MESPDSKTMKPNRRHSIPEPKTMTQHSRKTNHSHTTKQACRCWLPQVKVRRARRRNLCEQGKRVQENTLVNKISIQRLKVTKQATAQVTTAVLTKQATAKVTTAVLINKTL